MVAAEIEGDIAVEGADGDGVEFLGNEAGILQVGRARHLVGRVSRSGRVDRVKRGARGMVRAYSLDNETQKLIRQVVERGRVLGL